MKGLEGLGGDPAEMHAISEMNIAAGITHSNLSDGTTTNTGDMPMNEMDSNISTIAGNTGENPTDPPGLHIDEENHPHPGLHSHPGLHIMNIEGTGPEQLSVTTSHYSDNTTMQTSPGLATACYDFIIDHRFSIFYVACPVFAILCFAFLGFSLYASNREERRRHLIGKDQKKDDHVEGGGPLHSNVDDTSDDDPNNGLLGNIKGSPNGMRGMQSIIAAGGGDHHDTIYNRVSGGNNAILLPGGPTGTRTNSYYGSSRHRGSSQGGGTAGRRMLRDVTDFARNNITDLAVQVGNSIRSTRRDRNDRNVASGWNVLNNGVHNGGSDDELMDAVGFQMDAEGGVNNNIPYTPNVLGYGATANSSISATSIISNAVNDKTDSAVATPTIATPTMATPTKATSDLIIAKSNNSKGHHQITITSKASSLPPESVYLSVKSNHNTSVTSVSTSSVTSASTRSNAFSSSSSGGSDSETGNYGNRSSGVTNNASDENNDNKDEPQTCADGLINVALTAHNRVSSTVAQISAINAINQAIINQQATTIIAKKASSIIGSVTKAAGLAERGDKIDRLGRKRAKKVKVFDPKNEYGLTAFGNVIDIQKAVNDVERFSSCDGIMRDGIIKGADDGIMRGADCHHQTELSGFENDVTCSDSSRFESSSTSPANGVQVGTPIMMNGNNTRSDSRINRTTASNTQIDRSSSNEKQYKKTKQKTENDIDYLIQKDDIQKEDIQKEDANLVKKNHVDILNTAIIEEDLLNKTVPLSSDDEDELQNNVYDNVYDDVEQNNIYDDVENDNRIYDDVENVSAKI